jgi:hypothetical protein
VRQFFAGKPRWDQRHFQSQPTNGCWARRGKDRKKVEKVLDEDWFGFYSTTTSSARSVLARSSERIRRAAIAVSLTPGRYYSYHRQSCRWPALP